MKIDEMLSGAREAVTVKRVYGEPIERDGLVIVPAAKVAGGGGGGADSDSNGGGGFGIAATPAGAWVIRDGEVEWQPAVDATRIAVFGMVVAIIFLLVIRGMNKNRTKLALAELRGN